MTLLGLRKGGVKCSSACPFYAESGVVRGFGGFLKSLCRMIMHPWFVDCNEYNPAKIDELEVTEDEWKTMQKSVNKKAHKQRKPYNPEHAEIHPVGWKPQPGGCPKAKMLNRRMANKPVKN